MGGYCHYLVLKLLIHYEKIFDSRKLNFGKFRKLILLIIARKGIKKQIIREIDIDGNKIKLNILDYANLTKILHFAILD